MTIKQALKLKNKLVAEIKEQYRIALEFNSIEQGNVRRFGIKEALTKADDLTKELVELKTKIHNANAPVYGKIFEMSELKSTIKQLRLIPTTEGKVSGRYNSAPEVKEAEINAAEMNAMIKTFEKRIEELQDELDVHNGATTI